MSELFSRVRTLLDLLDQANGNPPDTTRTGTLSIKEYSEECRKLARCITILRWGLIGALGAMCLEHDIKANRYRKLMDFYDYPWQSPYQHAQQIGPMLDANCKPDLLVQPECMYLIFNKNRRIAKLQPREQKDLWDLARSGWHHTMLEKFVKNLERMRRGSSDRDDEIAELCRMAAERCGKLGNAFGSDGVAEDDLPGEGAGTDE